MDLFEAPFWALLALVVFFALLIYLKVPGTVAGSLDKRAKDIADELEKARQLREEAERLLADYKRRAREAEAEAAGIVEQARHEAAALAAESKRRMQEYVESRTRLAEQKIGQAEAQAVQEVRALSADVAISAAERILSERVRDGASAALVDQAIDDVKAKLN